MSDSTGFRRRLATILAIDVAGYSKSVEADEAGALRGVTELKRLIGEVAEAHAGRLFHTAGDGFLLEFFTVSGALEAADAIRTRAAAPLRIGVHMGEVSVTAEDDLLGHGVNVAARLQARAPVGGVLVSADVVRAERGDLARRFSPFGRIKLDKMRETLPVYLFEPVTADGTRRGLSPRLRRAALPAAGAAVAVIAAIGLAWAGATHWPGSGPRVTRVTVSGAPSLRVAAPRLDLLGTADPALQKFAGGLQAAMISHLDAGHISVAEGQGAGAAFGLGGTVEQDGADLLVRLRLDDLRQHVSIWSEEFRGPAKAPTALQAAVATVAAQVTDAALGADDRAKHDPDTIGLMIKADLYALRNRDEDREAEAENGKMLLAKLPDDPEVRSNLAIIEAFLASTSAPERAAGLKVQAAQLADQALKIDPRETRGYLAKYLAFPAIGHWREREAVLLAGLKAVPQSGLLTNHDSNFLREVGRLQDAVPMGRRAAAPKTPSANRDSTLVIALAAAGQSAEAASLAETDAKAWPTHRAVWNARLLTLLFAGRWTEAEPLFRPGGATPEVLNERERKAWLQALAAMASGDTAAKRAAAHAFGLAPTGAATITLSPHEVYTPGNRIGMLALLGAKDQAFAEAAAYLKPDAYADSSFLFWPNLGDFRRDPRFPTLASRIGLTDYWRATGKWPDFCTEPGPPYACRTLH